MICKRPACSNETPAKKPGPGRPSEYCSDECKHLADLERRGASREQLKRAQRDVATHEVRREAIEETASTVLSPLRPICDCGRPIVIVGDYACAVCTVRAKRAEKKKALRKRTSDTM